MFMQNPTVRDHAPTVIISLEVGGRALMTRDMEVIRNIILAIQARKTTDLEALEIPGVDAAVLARHLELLHDAQYIEAVKTVPLQGQPLFLVKDLTWSGHDFAAVLLNDTVWGKIKAAISPKDLATLPLSVVRAVGLPLLEKFAKQQLGLE
jgi:Hypothetical protein (DUF2513)